MKDALIVVCSGLLQGAARVGLFLAWWQIVKEYLWMATKLKTREELAQEEEQLRQAREYFGDVGGGADGGVEFPSVSNQRFFRGFLWFFANVLLAALLRWVLS